MDILLSLLSDYWLLIIVLAVGVIFYVGRDETKIGLAGLVFHEDDEDDEDEDR